MSEARPTYDDEIDLFEFFETLWGGKWKIVTTTFLATVVGVVFSIVQPNSYQVSTPIQNGKQSVFISYTSLNNLLKENEFSLSVDENKIFKMFISEFNDYEEVISVLSTDEFVKDAIKGLNEVDKQRVLVDFAKSFTLKPPSKNETNWRLSFEWHDDLEGERLFKDAIQLILKNIQQITKNNIDELVSSIDFHNSLKLESFYNELKLIEMKQLEREKRRIQYLIEQSAIAKELGIESNRLDANALSQSSQNGISLSVNSNDVPFYLRGFKAIDKEVLLIRKRSNEEKLLMASGYIEVKEKITSLENNLSSSQLRRASKIIENDNPIDWIEYDLALADSESQKKPMLYITLSIVLGGVIGVIYVLFLNAIHNRKQRLTI